MIAGTNTTRTSIGKARPMDREYRGDESGIANSGLEIEEHGRLVPYRKRLDGRDEGPRRCVLRRADRARGGELSHLRPALLPPVHRRDGPDQVGGGGGELRAGTAGREEGAARQAGRARSDR